MAAAVTVEEAHPLVGEIREAYLAGGGSEAEWTDIMSRPTLPGWAKEWFKAGEPDTLKHFDLLLKNYLVKYELIEYAVRDDEGTLTGYAVASVVEVKTQKNQLSLAVKHLHSNDHQFHGWAGFHLGPEADFHLHLCKRKVGSCTVKPSQKELGWLHVSAFRMLTYTDAFMEGYDPEPLTADLKEYVEVCLEELEEIRRKKQREAHPRQGGERKANPPAKRGDEELKRPGGVKPRETGGDPSAALKAASSKAGYQGKREKRAHPEEDGHADARALAAHASAALGAGHPQLIPRKGAVAERDGQPMDWLDKISVPGDDDNFPDPPDEVVKPERGHRHGGGPGGGHGGPESGDDRVDKTDRKRKKESRSPSQKRGRERKKSDRGKKDHKERRRRRGGGGPGGDPSSSPNEEDQKKPRRGEWLSPPPKEERKRKRRKKKKRSSGRSSSRDSWSYQDISV